MALESIRLSVSGTFLIPWWRGKPAWRWPGWPSLLHGLSRRLICWAIG